MSDKQSAAIRYAINRKGTGVCVGCGVNVEAVDLACPRCPKCKEIDRDQHRFSRDERIAKGVCYVHPNRPVTTMRTCQDCLDSSKKRASLARAQLRASGKCINCRKADAEVGRVRCRKCLDKEKRSSRSNIACERAHDGAHEPKNDFC